MELRFDQNRKFIIPKKEIVKLPEYVSVVEDGELDENESNAVLVHQRLAELLKPASGIINGDKVKNLIFPVGGMGFPKFDVFISHSHNDKADAIHLADYLREECGRTPFLDSYVWSSADGLMKEIDSQYSGIPNTSLFSYEKVQYTSSHVHTMLSMAILEMIARCESFIFIESNRSIDYNVLRATGRRTESPWLYQELQYVRMLSAARPVEIREGMYSDSMLRISYGVELKDFIPLDANNIDTNFKKRRRLS